MLLVLLDDGWLRFEFPIRKTTDAADDSAKLLGHS